MVSDDHGRVLAQVATSSAPEVLLVVDVPMGTGATLYAHAGDWFVWMVTLITIAMFLVSRRRWASGGEVKVYGD